MAPGLDKQHYGENWGRLTPRSLKVIINWQHYQMHLSWYPCVRYLILLLQCLIMAFWWLCVPCLVKLFLGTSCSIHHYGNHIPLGDIECKCLLEVGQMLAIVKIQYMEVSLCQRNCLRAQLYILLFTGMNKSTLCFFSFPRQWGTIYILVKPEMPQRL